MYSVFLFFLVVGSVDRKSIGLQVEFPPWTYTSSPPVRSPHHVEFRDSLTGIDVHKEGRAIRNTYGKDGTNVNFVSKKTEDTFEILTYERGVEAETLACGTGITAAALSAHILSKTSVTKLFFDAKGGQLSVEFVCESEGFTQIKLNGPATFVFKGEIKLS